jgi:bifunctional pyridoxal-dependent enzyme with beta-cystathionase and maltose regulon repressor activities
MLKLYSCEIVHVPFGDEDQFGLGAIEKYEQALVSAKESGAKVRGLVICNPHNPLGRNCHVNKSLIELTLNRSLLPC